MASSGLFTDALASLDASQVWRDQRVAAYEQLGVPVEAPSNQQVLDAARRLYDAHTATVDINTTAGADFATSSATGDRAAFSLLHAYRWSSRIANPAVARPTLASPTMSPGKQAAQADSGIATLVIGINAVGQIIVGEEGGIGVAFGLGGGGVAGMAYSAAKLGLAIDLSVNVFVGLWAGPPQDLGGHWYSIDVVAEVAEGVGVGLGVHLTPDLHLHGFSISVGVGFSLGASIAAGNTIVF